MDDDRGRSDDGTGVPRPSSPPLARDAVQRAMEIVRKDRHRPSGRTAFLMALHDMHRYYVGSAVARRIGGDGHVDVAASTGYGSFGELCARELGMDRQPVQRSIKEVLVGGLFCGVVAGRFGDGGGGGAGTSPAPDVAMAESVSPSAYRCLVTLVNEWQGRDDWIDTSREALTAWFAAPARRRLRSTFASIWARAKALAGPGGRPTRQHFATAYGHERASSSPSPSSSPSTLGKRKRRALSSASPLASTDRAHCPDDSDIGDDGREANRNRVPKSRFDDDDNNYYNNNDDNDTDDQASAGEDEDGDDLVSPADVCRTSPTGRPLLTTVPCLGARSPASTRRLHDAEAIVVTDALGRQYTLTPIVVSSPPPSGAPPTHHGSRAHTGHEQSTTTTTTTTTTPSLSVPVGATPAVASSVVSVPTTTTTAAASAQASSTHRGVGLPCLRHRAASSSPTPSTEDDDAEALRLEAGLARCARAMQRECAAGAPSDAQCAATADGRPSPPPPAMTTATTTTASATAKRDLFDAVSACMRYVADKTPAPEGESAPTAADWLRASCAGDARPDESADTVAAAASEPERRQRWRARRMLVGCLRAMAMLGDPCFAMAVVASLGDDLAQRQRQQPQQQPQRQPQQQQTPDTGVSPSPERQ